MSFIGERLNIKGRILFFKEKHPPVMGEKMSKRLGGIKGCKYKTSYFVLLGCGTYFIEDNAIQYGTVVIMYDNILHPMFTPDLCDYSRVLAVVVIF